VTRIEERGNELRGARREVLGALRAHGPQTARELAGILGSGVVAVRAHLRALVAAGLVTHVEERQALGRPARRFGLCHEADALFPKRYDLFAEKLLESVVERHGRKSLEAILGRWGRQLRRHLDRRLPKARAARLDGLVAHQSEHGFMASVRRDGGGLAIVERNCPIARLAARYPQICRHEAALFARTLGERVELISCQALGDSICTFEIGAAAVASAPAPASPAGERSGLVRPSTTGK